MQNVSKCPLFIAEHYSIVYVCHIFFICSPINVHFSVAMSFLLCIRLQWTQESRYLFEIVILILLDIHPEVELWNDMAMLGLVMWGNNILSSIAVAPLATGMHKISHSINPCYFLLLDIISILKGGMRGHFILYHICKNEKYPSFVFYFVWKWPFLKCRILKQPFL